MAVHDQLPIVEYDANGTTKVFAFNFRTIEVADITVLFDGKQQTTGYTVALSGDKGGNVTFATAPAAGITVQLRRNTPFSRDTDYVENGDLRADTIDDDFDRLWLALQEQRASSDTTMNKPVGSDEWDARNMVIAGLSPGVKDNDAATYGQVRTLNGDTIAASLAAKTSEQAAKTSETNAKGSENAAKTSETHAKTSETNAAASAAAALASKNAAKTSETNAKTSETNAGISAAAAAASETSVATNATTASNAATQAAGSQTAALASQRAAKTSETNAAASQTAAAGSASAAAASQRAAKTSETNAAASLAALDDSEANAAASATAAAQSASAALTSKNAAKVSETNAKASETSVATNATTASDAATAAAASQRAAKTSETNAKTSETHAKTSETNAAGSASAASGSATAATGSAVAAAASQTAAKTSETNAKASETAVAANKTIIDGYMDALKNAGSWIFRGELPAGKNINTLQPTDANAGIWQQSTPAQATTANGYPVASQPGILELFAHGMYGGAMRYTTSDGRVFLKHLTAAWNGTDGPWSSWYETGQARLNSYGIGISAQVTKTSFDWQQYNFNVGEHILVGSNVWTNPPNGLPTMPGTSICHIHVLGAAGTTLQLELTTNNVTDSAFVKYSLRIAGAKGSRTCKARKIFTDAALIPLEDGGTGGSYASKAALLQGLMDGFPLPLAKDGSAPNDAVTMRQLAQVSGTAGSGATMNGVMNNFIGAVEWFNGSRLKLPAGHVAADGQLLKRADYPDLWAAINAGMFAKVSDTQWQNGPGGGIPKGQYRGMYSTGDGTTTFRMPDLNGALAESIPALFLRGDASGRIGTEIGAVGEVLPAAAPDITAGVSLATSAGFAAVFHQPEGAINLTNQGGAHALAISDGGATNDRFSRLQFDASNSSQVYGRHNADGVHPATELRPNSVTGIWIIRASGAFTAANTSFSVIAGDATAPSSGEAKGGSIGSSYQINGVEVAACSFTAIKNIGTPHSVARLAVFNKGTGGAGGVEELPYFSFQSDGTAYAPGHWATSTVPEISYDQMLDHQGAYFASDHDTGGKSTFCSMLSSQTSNGTVARSAYHLGTLGPVSGNYGRFQMAGLSDTGSIARLGICCSVGDVEFVTGTSSSAQTFTLNKTLLCDRKFKDDIEYTEAAAAEALANVDAMKPTTYVLTYDEQKRQRRGFIAQDLQTIDAQYVKKMDLVDDGGNPYSQLRLDNNALLLDALLALHALSARVKGLEAEVETLKSKG